MLRKYFIVLLLIISPNIMAYSYTLEISEHELQNKLSAMMPMERKFLVASVIISNPEVKLLKVSNKISIFSNITVIAPDGAKKTGRIQFTGNLIYDAPQAAFYFKNPVIENLEIDHLPEQYAPDIKQIVQLALGHAMALYPVYTLQDSDLRQKYVKSVLETVTVNDGKLQVTLKPF
jgi:hypothetical protein